MSVSFPSSASATSLLTTNSEFNGGNQSGQRSKHIRRNVGVVTRVQSSRQPDSRNRVANRWLCDEGITFRVIEHHIDRIVRHCDLFTVMADERRLIERRFSPDR